MDVLFINTPSRDIPIVRDMAGGLGFDGGDSVALPPLTLCYMAATLIKKGKETKILDSDVEGYTHSDILQMAQKMDPKTVILTVSLPTLENDCTFIKKIQEQRPAAKIIALTNINFQPILKEILEKSTANFCIYSECDTIIDAIISEKEKGGTVRLINNELIVEKGPVLENLDELPLPARHLLSNQKYRYVLLGSKTTVMQTSRGCPYPCGYYCPYPLVQGKGWRERSPEHVIEEIEDILKNHGIKKILFRDAVFTLKKDRVHQICDLIIKKDLGITWWCETRVDCLDEAVVKKMKEAGCRGINVGVETGDPDVMTTQAKRGLTIEKLESLQKITKKFDIKLHFLLLIGFPEETKASLYKTYQLICNFRPESMGVCIITPYPGTQLYFDAKEKSWIETEDWKKFGGHTPIMRTDNLSTNDLFYAHKMLKIGFRLIKSPVGWIGSPILNYKFKKWSQN